MICSVIEFLFFTQLFPRCDLSFSLSNTFNRLETISHESFLGKPFSKSESCLSVMDALLGGVSIHWCFWFYVQTEWEKHRETLGRCTSDTRLNTQNKTLIGWCSCIKTIVNHFMQNKSLIERLWSLSAPLYIQIGSDKLSVEASSAQRLRQFVGQQWDRGWLDRKITGCKIRKYPRNDNRHGEFLHITKRNQ